MSLRQLFRNTLDHFGGPDRRQFPFISPPIERRQPRIDAEDYAARHSIDHTLARKAELRRIAPTRPDAAERYLQLLVWELAGLREMVTVLKGTTAGRDLHECVAEAREEIERLEVEVSWCNAWMERWRSTPPA